MCTQHNLYCTLIAVSSCKLKLSGRVSYLELSLRRTGWVPWLPSTVVADQKHKRGSGMDWEWSTSHRHLKQLQSSGLLKRKSPSFPLSSALCQKIQRWWVRLSQLCGLPQVLHHTCRPMVPHHTTTQVDAGERKSPCSGQSAFSG